jgi:NAD-dependent SIR2 family protein deacetylase
MRTSLNLSDAPVVYSNFNVFMFGFQDFVNKEAARKRYWARSMLGYKIFADSHPSYSHRSFSKLEDEHILKFTITQNVDRLHSKAGARNVLDLHGRNDRVKCLSCAYSFDRRMMQKQLDLLNPRVSAKYLGLAMGDRLRADGDAEVLDAEDLNIVVPCCPRCGGTLKPEVVFFGDSVPSENVIAANAQVQALL